VKLTSPSQVRALLAELGIQPSSALGQNFLIDRNILDIMLDVAALKPQDCVLEIGPGLGTLTETLVDRCGRVIAVEKDRRLYEFLSDRFKEQKNLELICGDFLEIDDASFCRLGIDKVVANLPYSVASRILVDLARSARPPSEISATLQLEVGERLAAQPGGHDYGLLTIWVQRKYDVAVKKTISPTCFYPAPKVRSAIVHMQLKKDDVVPLKDPALFYELTKHAFQHRRKQWAGVLSRAPGRLLTPLARAQQILAELGMDMKARPENLSVDDWCRFSNALAESHPRLVL
jgi:16S rRNA (adenine1518-N6/adenine1519-N6)-dimethyltransferase